PSCYLSLHDALPISDPVRPLLTAVPSSTQVVQCHSFANNSEQIHFECVLTKGQVNAIEDYRLEGDLKLNVGLRALTTSGDGLLTDRKSTRLNSSHVK